MTSLTNKYRYVNPSHVTWPNDIQSISDRYSWNENRKSKITKSSAYNKSNDIYLNDLTHVNQQSDTVGLMSRLRFDKMDRFRSSPTRIHHQVNSICPWQVMGMKVREGLWRWEEQLSTLLLGSWRGRGGSVLGWEGSDPWSEAICQSASRSPRIGAS